MANPPAVQQDLYLQLADGDLRDLIPLLEFPFFGLAARPSMQTREYVSPDGKTYLRCSPGSRGAATQWDHDIMIYCISMLYRMNLERKRQRLGKNDTLRLNNSTGSYELDDDNPSILSLLEDAETDEDGDARLSFVAHDLLKLLRRQTGQRAYLQLKESLFRLRSTTIETNIGSDTGENRVYGWLSKYEFVEDAVPGGGKRMKRIDVWITPWVIQALAADNSVLQIDPAYFDLDSGLEKRLYQLARKHCGRQERFSISLGKLAAKVGTTQPLRQFKSDLLKAIEADNIPEYLYSVADADPGAGRKRLPLDRVIVTITQRKGLWVGSRVLAKAERQLAKGAVHGPSDCANADSEGM